MGGVAAGHGTNNHPTLRAEPEDKGDFCKPDYHALCAVQPDWSLLLLVNMQCSLQTVFRKPSFFFFKNCLPPSYGPSYRKLNF